MAWTAPLTAVAGGIFSASIFNTYIRDNLNEMAPAKSTVVSSWFPVSGVNQVTERYPAQMSTLGSSTTTSTSFGNLADGITTSVTVSTGTQALVLIYSTIDNSGTNRTWMSYQVSGATATAADDTRSINQGTSSNVRWGATFLSTLTAGSNTFTLRYRVTAGTGTFAVRRIGVIPF